MPRPALALLFLSLLGGCRDDARTIHLFAAASLAEALGPIEAAFEAAHPGHDLVISTAGSQALRLQIEHGAAPALFISANPEHADALVSQALATDPHPLARNRLVLAVPRSNPAGIRRLADLPRAERVVIGDAAVPAGQYAHQALTRAGLLDRVRIASREANVRLVLAKVELGEADAALVYRTDTLGRDAVRAVELPWPITAEYRLVTVTASPAAARLRAFLLGPGRARLREAGFD